MTKEISIAIETSCRAGGVALGVGDELALVEDFDASTRHAGQLVSRLEALLAGRRLRPREVNHVYVSAGPGSFTGLRIGITVARTLAQAVGNLCCVAVPTAAAVAENLRTEDWEHLGVVLDAKEGRAYSVVFERRGGRIARVWGPAMVTGEEFLERAPRPLLVTGEGLEHQDLSGPQVRLADPKRYLPTAQSVWRVGRRMAAAGRFTDYRRLLPVYARKPEAVRLWEKRGQSQVD